MNIYDQIVQLSYAYFANRRVTPEEIENFIARMKLAFSDQAFDDRILFNKLEAIYSVVIKGSVMTLEDSVGHEEWFNVSTNLPIRRHFEWHYWDHLKTYLSTVKGRPATIVNSLDKESSEILSRLEDPMREGTWCRRGMVMGSVQSGKTANYTALICKALDAGYKLIIILAGVHDSLRSQTQERLNEELLGYDLDRIQRLTGQERRIGVRRIFADHKVVNTLTSSNQKGDFNRRVATQAGILPSVTGDPIILVIKKHVSIMNNLINWLKSLPGVITVNRRKIVPDVPMILIDDECDFASVNTRRPEYDENGNINEEWDPTKTNAKIRTLLTLFQKCAYIGYTATPYANIFIHNEHYHPVYGDDIFPRHFIISLPQPSNYIGPENVFGIPEDSVLRTEEVAPLPLIRYVADTANIIPASHKKELRIHNFPDTMIEAIRAFILVCAARKIRQTGIPHNSMLIHVTRFNAVQRKIKELVEDHLKTTVARIMAGQLSEFRDLWEKDFKSTSEKMSILGFRDVEIHDWDAVSRELFEQARKIKVKGINGEISDILDYREADALARERALRGEEVPWEEKGINVIAIGGDKLSRGLTLDGLTISYYLRASRMYDTLMQMGRWFGYRDGYNDLCRIYTTEELALWYRYIAMANQELRNELEYMKEINSTPEKYGLKVRSFPGRLAVTSAGKARNAERLSLSFAGQFPKTIVFDPRYSASNRRALLTMIEKIGTDCSRPVNPEKPRFYWGGVDPKIVIRFLRDYTTHETERKVVDPDRIADFIERQLTIPELTEWHVIVVSNDLKYAEHSCTVGNYTIGCVKRSPDIANDEKISIGTLTSPADEVLDLNDEELERAFALDRANGKELQDGLPSSIAIRRARPVKRGLLLIYMPVCRNPEPPARPYGLDGEEVVGFAVSFPKSENAQPIEYWAGPVYLEEN